MRGVFGELFCVDSCASWNHQKGFLCWNSKKLSKHNDWLIPQQDDIEQANESVPWFQQASQKLNKKGSES
jgi:hypothetical protein